MTTRDQDPGTIDPQVDETEYVAPTLVRYGTLEAIIQSTGFNPTDLQFTGST